MGRKQDGLDFLSATIQQTERFSMQQLVEVKQTIDKLRRQVTNYREELDTARDQSHANERLIEALQNAALLLMKESRELRENLERENSMNGQLREMLSYSKQVTERTQKENSSFRRQIETLRTTMGPRMTEDEKWDMILQILEFDTKVQAVQAYRKLENTGLHEAKKAVDAKMVQWFREGKLPTDRWYANEYGEVRQLHLPK